MELVLISDTHCQHHEIALPPGDVLVCAGDFCSYGKLSEVEDFGHWLSELDYKHIVVVAGNHDWPFDRPGKRRKALRLLGDVTYLEDSRTVIDGVKFWGSPWQPQFYAWAFNLPRGKALRDKWAQIPEDTDVLITHGPPYGICDRNMEGENVGCEDLLDRVLTEVRPKLHVFGHIHVGYGMNWRLLDGSIFVNASICDEQYLPTNQPVEVEI